MSDPENVAERSGTHAPTLRFDELKTGVSASIIRISGDAEHAARCLRLREMGFDEGVEVEILHRAAFGADPIAVRIGSNLVAMRTDYAQLIEVKPVEDTKKAAAQ